MQNITITINEDTFVYTEQPAGNFSSSNELFLEQNEQCQVSRILIKFPIDSCTLKGSKNILGAKLCLYVKSVGSSAAGVNVYRNREDFNYKTVTWDNKPNSVYTGLGNWISDTKTNRYAEIDITDLLKDWLDNKFTNYGIQLVLSKQVLGARFSSSRTDDYPYVLVTLKDDCRDDVVPQFRGMQIQSKNFQGVIIKQNEAIVFDSILNNTTVGIYNDDKKGTITFNKCGSYYISWWVSVAGAKSHDISFVVKNEDESIKIQCNTYLPVCGQVTGMGFITIANTPQIFKLVNASGEDVQLDLVMDNIQASLVILQFSS